MKKIIPLILLASLYLQFNIGVIEQQSPPLEIGLGLIGSHGSSGVSLDTANSFLDPIRIIDPDNWDFISNGGHYVLAIKNGELFAWGTGFGGALGLGTQSPAYVPTKIGAFSDWTMCSTGTNFSAAIRAGRLYTWGTGSSGQLGLGGTSSHNTPQQVGIDTDWTWVGCGHVSTCAIKGGQLLTTGSNFWYTTGLNTDAGTTINFTLANSDTDWVSCKYGNYRGLALKDSPTELWSWGNNGSGQCGQGNTTNIQIPTLISGHTGWTDYSAGLYSSGGIIAGELYMWGSGAFGNLGTGNTTNQTSPVKIGVDTDWSRIAIASAGIQTNYTTLGGYCSFAVKTNTSLYGAGINNYKFLGLSSATAQVTTFTLLSSEYNITDISAGNGNCLFIIEE